MQLVQFYNAASGAHAGIVATAPFSAAKINTGVLFALSSSVPACGLPADKLLALRF